MKNVLKVAPLVVAVSMALTACGSSSSSSSNNTTNDDQQQQPTPFAHTGVYKDFPITLSGDFGDAKTSESYAGQMARHVIQESLKSAISSPDNTSYAVIGELTNYYKNTDNVLDDNTPKAPAANGVFAFKETTFGSISTGRNLSGKIYDPEDSGDPIEGVADADKAVVLGWPGNKTADSLVQGWINFAGADYAGHVDGTADGIDTVRGHYLQQMISKFLLGAVFYNQTVDKYLDENLEADVKPNNEAYGDGARFTGKEHSWDEGFGYWGAAAHANKLTAEQNYHVAKRGTKATAEEALGWADADKDGKVSLYTEMNYGHAYYAYSFDKDGKTTYGETIMNAFLDGRTLIANASAKALTDEQRTQLKAYRDTIVQNWEKVIAEAVFKYAGSTYSDIEKLESGQGDVMDYYKHWGELKGFMLALQYGGQHAKINKTTFEEIDNLIGYGPVLENGKQVNGSEPGARGDTYLFAEGLTLADYKAKMVDVQNKIKAFYDIKALQNDKTGS